MPSLKEVLENLSTLKQKQAVYETIINLLENEFLSRDEREPDRIITCDDGEEVTQEVIGEVIDHISDEVIGPLQVECARLQDAPVDLGEKKKAAKKAAKKKGAKKAAKKKGAKKKTEDGGDGEG